MYTASKVLLDAGATVVTKIQYDGHKNKDRSAWPPCVWCQWRMLIVNTALGNFKRDQAITSITSILCKPYMLTMILTLCHTEWKTNMQHAVRSLKFYYFPLFFTQLFMSLLLSTTECSSMIAFWHKAGNIYSAFTTVPLCYCLQWRSVS